MKTHSVLCTVVIWALGCGGGGDSKVDARAGFDAANRIQRVYLVKEVTLPSTSEEVNFAKFEYPGSGVPVNKLGSLLQALLPMLEGLDVQENLNANYLNGEGMEVFTVLCGDLDVTDDGANGSFSVVEDADDPPDPSNNWDGEGQVKLPDGVEFIPTLKHGILEDGVLEAHGDADTEYTFLMPFFAGEEPMTSTGVYAQARVTVTEETFIGVVGNVVTPEEYRRGVFPLASRLLTQAIQEDLPTKEDVKNKFDANGDDNVTIEELNESDLMATLTQPDVDLNEDGTLDHLSQGIIFEAVRVELVTE